MASKSEATVHQQPDTLTPPSGGLRLGIGAAIVLMLIAAVVAVVVVLSGDAAGTSQNIAPGRPSNVGDTGTGPASDAHDTGNTGSLNDSQVTVFVHILGAVSTPGLYALREGARVIDVVAAAGGLSDDAEQAGINLARPVSDGEQIYVPHVGENPPPGGAVGGTAGGAASSAAGSPINLNEATATELEELPRIGPAMAARIVAWREENGRFTSVEDLLAVTGIGAKTLEGLRELVTV